MVIILTCNKKRIIDIGISLALSFVLILLNITALGFQGDKTTLDNPIQFAEELSKLEHKNPNRIIVSSNREISTKGAEGIATGIEGLYVLQYPDSKSAKKAYDYYNSLAYVKYAVYDTVEDFSPCEVENGSEYKANCVSSVDTNIDDAIKLIDKVKGSSLPVINVGVLDSGIARNNVTKSRLYGGHTYFEGQNEDGTSDSYGHGTNVAGTIINNTLSNVHLYSYQIYVKGVSSEIRLSNIVSAFYLAKEDGCKIISCSFAISSGEINRVLNEVVTDLSKDGIIVVAGAGNDSSENVMTSPSCCNDSISVGATDGNRRLASFSNFGSIVDIYATGRGLTSIYQNGETNYNFQGTSAATPVVSSICALLLEIKPELKVDDIKELLLETGTATNEDEMSDEHRLIADAYGCIKELTGQELETTDLSFETDGKTFTFHSNDENAEVYYYNHRGGFITVPYRDNSAESSYSASIDEINTAKSGSFFVIACAYSPGKAKSKVELFQVPVNDYEYGYLINEANATSEYNTISRCEITDEQTMIIPEHINGVEVQEIGNYCYMGNQTVEKIVLPETVKKIDAYAFANCPNLKTVIASGAEYCGRYAFYDCPNLKNVEMPLVTQANTAMFKNCKSLETAKLGYFSEIDNHAFFGCEKLKLVKTSNDDISFAKRTFNNCNNLTILATKNSVMEAFAKENKIPLLGNMEALGGSIRITNPGLRLGFKYVGEFNPNIDEYGFEYAYSDTSNLNKTKTANNRINHGDYTSYNLVITGIPKNNFETIISARAYIKIGGEYFYSDILKRSFMSVAESVLEDDAVSDDIKSRINEMIKT